MYDLICAYHKNIITWIDAKHYSVIWGDNPAECGTVGKYVCILLVMSYKYNVCIYMYKNSLFCHYCLRLYPEYDQALNNLANLLKVLQNLLIQELK